MAPYHPVVRTRKKNTPLVERDEQGRRRFTREGRVERNHRILDILRQQNVILNERPTLTERERHRRIRLITTIFQVHHHPIEAFFALHDFVLFEREHLIGFSQQVEKANERIEGAATRFESSGFTTEIDRKIRRTLTRGREEHQRILLENEKNLKMYDRLVTQMTPVNRLLRHSASNPHRNDRLVDAALVAFDDVYENDLIQKRIMGRKHTMRGEMHLINRLRGQI